jgi:hypothetical protein
MLLDKQLFSETRRLKLGESVLPEHFKILQEWINSHYSINVLNIIYDKIEIGPHKGSPRLNVIIDNLTDYQKMFKKQFMPIEKRAKSISNRFEKIIEQTGLRNKYDLDNIYVIYSDYSYNSMSKVCELFIQNEKKNIMSKFAESNIWDMTGYASWIVVFCLTDKDLNENIKNGTNENIKKECLRLLKLYDEFDYFNEKTLKLTFDSKQNFDENYQGNSFYYFR